MNEEGVIWNMKSINWRKVWDLLGGRKFLGFAFACLFLTVGRISDAVWVTAFGLYVGANVAQKVLLERRDGQNVGESQSIPGEDLAED